MKLLEVDNLTIKYGAITAVSGLSFTVDEDETVLLTGPNGTGKSSVLLAIMGIVRPVSGEIRFKGESLHRYKSWDRVRLGIGILPENRRLFDDLTVKENLSIVLNSKNGESKADIKLAYKLFPILRERRNFPARILSGGERQMLALARIHLKQPYLCLLDDPIAGIDRDLAYRSMHDLLNLGSSRLIATPEIYLNKKYEFHDSRIIHLSH